MPKLVSKHRGPTVAEIQYIEGTTVVVDIDGTEKRLLVSKTAKVDGIEGNPKATIADLQNYDIIEVRGIDHEIGRVKVVSRVTQDEALARSKAKVADAARAGFNTKDEMQPKPAVAPLKPVDDTEDDDDLPPATKPVPHHTPLHKGKGK